MRHLYNFQRSVVYISQLVLTKLFFFAQKNTDCGFKTYVYCLSFKFLGVNDLHGSANLDVSVI